MSIINDALKKVQANLDKKDTTVSPPEQKPAQATTPQQPQAEASPPVSPRLKTLATIEQEEKEKESQLKKQQQLMMERRRLPLTKLLKISFFIFLFVCFSTFIFFSLTGYLKKNPFYKKMSKPAVKTQSFKKNVEVLTYKPPTPKSAVSNPPSSLETSSKTLSVSSVKKISPQNFVLKGIVTQNNHQIALINDGIYEEGATVEGMKVTSISLKEVKLSDGDQTIILTIEGTRP